MPDANGKLLPGEPNYTPPGSGLINLDPSGSTVAPLVSPVAGYTPAQATPSAAASKSYEPSGVAVLDQDTVQGQLDQVLAKDSKLLQRADVRSRQQMAGSGLINSTMALQAGQAAVIDAALPIAQQDAQTNFTANTKTVDAQNAAKNFGAAGENQASLANAQLGTDVSKANAGMINEAGARASQAANEQMIARLDAATRTQIANLDATTKTALATMDAQNRQLLQGNQNAANMFQQTVTDITNISTNPNMTQAAKDAAVATALNLLREGLGVTSEIARTEAAAIQGLDLGQYFVNGTEPGTPTTPTTPTTPGTPAPAGSGAPLVQPEMVQPPQSNQPAVGSRWTGTGMPPSSLVKTSSGPGYVNTRAGWVWQA